MYRIFYNYKTCGDVLFIVIKPNEIPDKTIKNNDVIALYKNNVLVGINIFSISKIIKIKSEGMIVAPSEEFLNVINHILTNAGLDKLEFEESGFKVGKVLSCEDHPDSEHLHVCKVDVGSEILDIVCGAKNVAAGEKVVVAMPYTIMFDGSQIIPSTLRGEKSNGMLCSARELHIDAPVQTGLHLLDDSYKIGEDFFK